MRGDVRRGETCAGERVERGANPKPIARVIYNKWAPHLLTLPRLKNDSPTYSLIFSQASTVQNNNNNDKNNDDDDNNNVKT